MPIRQKAEAARGAQKLAEGACLRHHEYCACIQIRKKCLFNCLCVTGFSPEAVAGEEGLWCQRRKTVFQSQRPQSFSTVVF